MTALEKSIDGLLDRCISDYETLIRTEGSNERMEKELSCFTNAINSAKRVLTLRKTVRNAEAMHKSECGEGSG